MNSEVWGLRARLAEIKAEEAKIKARMAEIKAASTKGTGLSAFGEMKSKSEWARDSRCAVSLTALVSRLANGWKPEDAITTQSGGRSSKLTAFGATKSYLDWSRDPRCVVSLSCLRARIQSGWESEKALRTVSDTARKVEAGKEKATLKFIREVIRESKEGL